MSQARRFHLVGEDHALDVAGLARSQPGDILDVVERDRFPRPVDHERPVGPQLSQHRRGIVRTDRPCALVFGNDGSIGGNWLGFGLRLRPSEGASTMTLPTSSTGAFGAAASAAASEAAASFSAANETGTGHNNPSTSSAQSKQAALILDATCLIPTIRSRSFTIRETASSQVRAWNFKRSSKQRPQAISR